MSRIARVVVPGVPHHVTERGNRGEAIFFADSDRREFLGLLEEYAGRYGLELLAYCLMTNHVHFIVVPEAAASLARVFKPLNLRYAQAVNRRQGWSGRLWQERFYSCPLDAQHCLLAARYVEQNPVRARLVRRAEEWPWSSAAGHAGLRPDPHISDRAGRLSGVGDWQSWLRERDDTADIELLRLRTRTGRPCGTATFEAGIGKRLRRRVTALPVGRPRSRPA